MDLGIIMEYTFLKPEIFRPESHLPALRETLAAIRAVRSCEELP